MPFYSSSYRGNMGVLQLGTRTLSDKIGRKSLIYTGMIVQAAGIWIVLFANSISGWIIGICLCLMWGLHLCIQHCLQQSVMSLTPNGEQLLLESRDSGGIWVLSLEL